MIAYAFIVFAMTVLNRQPGTKMRYELQLLWSYCEWDTLKEEIIANVIVFIPIGVLAGAILRWKGILIGFGYSAVIELIQLLFHRGLFEFDDILHNTFGTALGMILFLLVHQAVQKIKEMKN